MRTAEDQRDCLHSPLCVQKGKEGKERKEEGREEKKGKSRKPRVWQNLIAKSSSRKHGVKRAVREGSIRVYLAAHFPLLALHITSCQRSDLSGCRWSQS